MSRCLGQVGKYIFSLPICLRDKRDPGYPLSDKPVVEYFQDVPNNDDMSLSAYHQIACFIAAAHTTMLEWLERAPGNHNGEQLLAVWHEAMEKNANNARSEFFIKAVALAKRANRLCLLSRLHTNGQQIRAEQQPVVKSPGRSKQLESDLHKAVEKFYREITGPATQKLLAFISSLFPKNKTPLCVTYFDEADELNVRLLVMFRLLKHQLLTVGMWYIFMGTKLSISYDRPAPKDREAFIYDRVRNDSPEHQYPLSNFDRKWNDSCHRISLSALTSI